MIAYLRLNGVNSKEHPVFRELTRVKQYFEKIKAAESAGTARNMTLDKAATGRFIRNALVSRYSCAMNSARADFQLKAGNQKFGLNPAKQNGKESAASHTRFEQLPNEQISNDLGVGSRTVSSSDDPDSDPEHLESHDVPSSKRINVQSANNRRESDDGAKAGVKQGLNLSSGTASKIDSMNVDSKADQKKKKTKLRKERKMLEGFERT